ncbi:MAG: hypothetical protein AB1725_02520 [Armatimonadota bacterium]
MAQDKKKLLIIGILFLALVAVGTYQFVGSGPAAKKSSVAKAEEPKDSGTAEQPEDGESPSNLYALGFSPRNPFQPGTLPNDQKPSDSENNNRIVHAPPEPRVSTPYGGEKPPWDPTIPGVDMEPGGESLPAVNEFTYTLIGLVDGPTPVAVFLTGDGVQKMVRVGEYVGQNAKVVRIQNGAVTIQADGKTITQRVGGN